jgi:hypothetical protein
MQSDVKVVDRMENVDVGRVRVPRFQNDPIPQRAKFVLQPRTGMQDVEFGERQQDPPIGGIGPNDLLSHVDQNGQQHAVVAVREVVQKDALRYAELVPGERYPAAIAFPQTQKDVGNWFSRVPRNMMVVASGEGAC